MDWATKTKPTMGNAEEIIRGYAIGGPSITVLKLSTKIDGITERLPQTTTSQKDLRNNEADPAKKPKANAKTPDAPIKFTAKGSTSDMVKTKIPSRGQIDHASAKKRHKNAGTSIKMPPTKG